MSRAGVEAATEFEQRLLSDLRRYMTALQRLTVTVVYSLLVVLLTAVATRLVSCILCWSRDPRRLDSREPGDDDVTPVARPATVSVSAQTRNLTMFDLRFSETKV